MRLVGQVRKEARVEAGGSGRVAAPAPAAVPGKAPPLKKYKCDMCGKAFSRSNTLITHKVKQLAFLAEGNMPFVRQLLI